MSIADKLSTIAENEQKVFDAGKQEEYDRFWDAFQANGNRVYYANAFSNASYSNKNLIYANWTADTFKPKYPIKPIGANDYPMFAYISIPNFKQHCETYGIVIDCSEMPSLINAFRCLKTAYIPDINASKATKIRSCFYECTGLLEAPYIYNGELITDYNACYYACDKLVKIPIIWAVAEPVTNAYANAFGLIKLEEIGEIKGSIRENISFGYSSKLTIETLRKILTALSKTTSGKALTLNTASKAKIEADSNCSEQVALAVSAGWTIAYA